MTVEKKQIQIILPYSPKNRNAKSKDPYSILNPETNSLSPSAKSKGERFVSATIMINQIKIKKKKKSILKQLLNLKFQIFNEKQKIKGKNK